MITFNYIEEYIEVIAGYRGINGKVDSNYLFSTVEPLISLARYDTKVVPSLAEQSLSGTAYTDRQAALAVKLLATYERQLAKRDIDVGIVKNPVFKMPIRRVDRTTRVWVEDNLIRLRYPFNTEMIDQMRTAAKASHGQIRFNRELRLQEADLTEWNLNFCYSFAQQHKFEIDSSVQDLMDLILAVEKTNYKIELVIKNGKISITNAESSLTDYIEQHHGGINNNNLVHLIDIAPLFGYVVSEEILQVVTAECGERFASFCTNRQLKGEVVTEDIIADLVTYIKAVERFPVYVYEPTPDGKILKELNRHFADQMQMLVDTQMKLDPDAKVIYTSRIPKYPVTHIPLLISTAGMLFGGDRQMWIQTAEKIVYFTKDVYNKNTKDTPVISIA